MPPIWADKRIYLLRKEASAEIDAYFGTNLVSRIEAETGRKRIPLIAVETAASSGAHLTSFSLVDLAAHGAACGIMNPYYAVLYTPAIQPQLKSISRVLARYGYVPEGTDSLQGRELSQAVAGGLIAFGKAIHAPTKLSDLDGFGEKHIQRILTAAKEPSLDSANPTDASMLTKATILQAKWWSPAAWFSRITASNWKGGPHSLSGEI